MRLNPLSRFGVATAIATLCVWPAVGQEISDSAARQIQDFLAAKGTAARGTGRKVSSRLTFASMKAQQQTLPSVTPDQFSDIPMGSGGQALVDIRARGLQPVLDNIAAAGGTVIYASGNAIRAEIPLSAVESLAAMREVRFIKPAALAQTNSFLMNSNPFASPTAPAAARFAAWQASRQRTEDGTPEFPLLASNGVVPGLRSLLRPAHIAPFIGAITSQGYVSHQALPVVNSGINGTGVRIGVLSDSALPARVSALIASGDLPGDVTVLPGQAGPTNGSDEGAAMMEIVHDLAPGAKLFFATAFTSEQSFADNIRALRYQYGCDIIVDDISYFDEGVFQDSTVSQAVNDVTANGALYFSSAANSGNLTSGTSGTWEGDYQFGAFVTPPVSGTEGAAAVVHNFGTAAQPVLYETLRTGTNFIGLHWSDPLGGSANDYDLFVLDSAGAKVLAASTDSQTGTQDPYEAVYLQAGFPAGSRILIVKFAGAARALHLDTERGSVTTGTAGATFGHNAAQSTVTLAATAWNSAHRGTVPFTGFANPVETFSSDGPRQMFFLPNGNAITPGKFLFGTGGGTAVQKPDLTAADGVSTHTPGFTPFFGTSAAAPHAAAVAGLVKSANLLLTNTQIRNILVSTSLDTMAVGPDRDSGYGITMAPAAVNAALAQH